jgi:hypothetical protein
MKLIQILRMRLQLEAQEVEKKAKSKGSSKSPVMGTSPDAKYAADRKRLRSLQADTASMRKQLEAHINVDTKEFHVNRLKGCDSGPHQFYNGESKAVKAWLAERAKMAPAADIDTLFISERRKPLSRCTVWHILESGSPGVARIGEIAKAAGLEHLEIHPHMLRHSCGYALVNKGTDSGRPRASVDIIDGAVYKTGQQAIRETVLIRGFKWLGRFFEAGRSIAAPAVPIELPVKHQIGTRFVIARENGRLESVPVTEK